MKTKFMRVAVVDQDWNAFLRSSTYTNSTKQPLGGLQDTNCIGGLQTYHFTAPTPEIVKWSKVVPEKQVSDAMHEAIGQFTGKSIKITVTQECEIENEYVAEPYRSAS